jgi:DMSO/TMAO reductase YedYZ molybdopterin-dependent catalytic subunit
MRPRPIVGHGPIAWNFSPAIEEGGSSMKPDDEEAGLADAGLPPGQYRTDGFPRFGVALDRPPPEVPNDPAIEIAGAVTARSRLLVADLATLARREVTADFHCVAGWSATNLRWEGVAFETLYRELSLSTVSSSNPRSRATPRSFTSCSRVSTAIGRSCESRTLSTTMC